MARDDEMLNELHRDVGVLTAEVQQMRAVMADLRTELREQRHLITQQQMEFQRLTNRGYGVLIGVGLLGGGIGAILPMKIAKLIGLS